MPQEIVGKDKFDLFKEIKEDGTLLEVRLMGKNYQRLTMVTDVQLYGGEPGFFIDYPAGFKEAVEHTNVWKLRFEFSGRDKVPYNFTTSGGRFIGNKTFVYFPDFVERNQRRKDFRVEPPFGSRVFFETDIIKAEMSILNISLGGLFGVLRNVKTRKALERGSILKEGKNLFNLRLEFPPLGFDEINIDSQLPRTITIEKAVVKRSDTNPEKKTQERYAFQFTKVDKKELGNLSRMIHIIQGHLLRKRSGVA